MTPDQLDEFKEQIILAKIELNKINGTQIAGFVPGRLGEYLNSARAKLSLALLEIELLKKDEAYRFSNY